MSDLATLPPQNGESKAPETKRREIRVVEDDGPLAFMMDTARYEHLQRIASTIAASAFLPEHLLGEKVNGQFQYFDKETRLANCFRVVNQAMRWKVDPYAVCDETYVVKGKLGYGGKLVAAIVNSRAGLRGRLTYSYKGSGADREITVSGTFADMPDSPCQITLTVAQAKTDNQMWRNDPDQKLVYSGATKWARRYCPEIIMGILTEDDIERSQAPQISDQTRSMLPTQSLADVMQNAPKETDFIDSTAVSSTPPGDSAPPQSAGAGEGSDGSSTPPVGETPDAGGAGEGPDLTPGEIAATADTFGEWFVAQAKAKGIDDPAAMLAKARLNNPLGRLSARETFVVAFQEGRFDWETAKVTTEK